jgi:hypothetical protein
VKQEPTDNSVRSVRSLVLEMVLRVVGGVVTFFVVKLLGSLLGR